MRSGVAVNEMFVQLRFLGFQIVEQILYNSRKASEHLAANKNGSKGESSDGI